MLNRKVFDLTRHGFDLHCAGSEELAMARHLVCVTGTRRATPYGLALAEASGRIVAESGHVLLTTAALGCSVAAARAALDAGGDVVVMAATGCNVPWPATSTDVFERAAATLSLAKPDAPATRSVFAARDHALVHLADTLVVCEAGVPSGAFSLADEMLGLEKKVLVFPGSVFSQTSTGANELIAHGATMLTGPDALAAALDPLHALTSSCASSTESSPPDEVLRCLVASPMRPDDLARALGVPVLDILRRLASYEMSGAVQRLPDGRYAHVPPSAL